MKYLVSFDVLRWGSDHQERQEVVVSADSEAGAVSAVRETICANLGCTWDVVKVIRSASGIESFGSDEETGKNVLYANFGGFSAEIYDGREIEDVEETWW